MLADYKPGATVLLKRNPNYWKMDEQGRKLPYLDSIRLDINPTVTWKCYVSSGENSI